MTPEAALIEIYEVRDPAPADGIIVPNEIRINGHPVLTPEGHPITVHELTLNNGSGSEAVLVTLTLFARRVVIGADPDAGAAPRPPEAHRQNVIASAVIDAWGKQWLPLSVRYAAARAADDVVQAWAREDDQ